MNASTKDFSGKAFPNAPKWQSNVDAQYDIPIGEWVAFVGANMNYQSKTRGFFVDRCNEGAGAIDPIKGIPVTCTDGFLASNPQNYGDCEPDIIARAILDVRPGIEHGPWRVWAWGRNVTNKWYWNQSQHVNDVLLRYTAMPVTYGITVSYRYGQ
jgi:hypothetical protein